jgi:outer membrane protein TolC
VLAQFPRLSLGVNRARDTGNVITNGLSFAIELPFFDRNQGPIAVARATRQQLFDEYASRVFDARSAIAAALAEIHSLNEQVRAAGEADAAFHRLADTYRAALADGQVDAVSFATVWRSYQSAAQEQLALRRRLVEARVGLELASGLSCVDRGVAAGPPGESGGEGVGTP